MNIIKEFPILLPKNIDMEKWGIIACDQYTTDIGYWNKLLKYVGSAPSALHLIFPEIYLKSSSDEIEKRIDNIDDTMNKYLKTGIFSEINGFILVERTINQNKKRIGLIACVDLEEYDYSRNDVKIRSTEETIEERLPIRIHIREKAPIELPHILLLMDDAEKTVIEPLYVDKNKYDKLYDFDLNMDGGHICGYKIPFSDELISKFNALLDKNLQISKYGKDAGILFAVGDGNHSMATAKKCWENIKQTLTEDEKLSHPARYALVEIINLYDDALDFLPIHRNIKNCNPDVFCARLQNNLNGSGELSVFTHDGEKTISCPSSPIQTIIDIQNFLEKEKNNGAIIEYVHEKEKVIADSLNDDCVGIIMPSFPKECLFDYTVNTGKLPKKAFSIGEEKTKKYYIEAKRIK